MLIFFKRNILSRSVYSSSPRVRHADLELNGAADALVVVPDHLDDVAAVGGQVPDAAPLEVLGQPSVVIEDADVLGIVWNGEDDADLLLGKLAGQLTDRRVVVQ